MGDRDIFNDGHGFRPFPKKPVVTERNEPVMVCELCGRGFLVSPGSKIDPVPIWFTSFSKSDGACLGNIRMADRRHLIRNLDNRELQNVKTR